jgi:Flp pilus assembly pilin Flp
MIERTRARVVQAVTFSSNASHKSLASSSYTATEEGRMTNLLKLLWQDQRGQDLTEYALLLALIALGAITSMKTIASTINSLFANSASKIAAP